MRKILGYILVLCLGLMGAACKKDKPSRVQPRSNYNLYTHYRNFIIDKIQMSRVTIEGVPTNGHTLYMLQAYTIGCNQETQARGEQVEGGHKLIYEEGLADTIYCIEFKTKANENISPHPLNWNGHIGESCILSLSEVGDEKTRLAFYEGNIRNLPYDITYPSRLWIHATRFIEDGNKAKDTLTNLISFREKRKLPDSVILVLQGTSIKVPIDYSSKREYHLIWRSDFMGYSETTKAELEAKVKAIQMKRKKEYLLRKRQKNQ